MPHIGAQYEADSAEHSISSMDHAHRVCSAIPHIGTEMTSLANMLKGEITRLARKEVRALVEPLRKTNAKYRHDIAVLKQQLAEQQRAIAALRRSRGGKAPADDAPATARFSAKGLRALRARLGLSAAQFGQLAGVSAQSIYNWETGKTDPRQNQKAAIAGMRSLGKRAAQARLEELSASGKKRTKS